MKLNLKDLHSLLEDKYEQFNTPEFIKDDPIQLPHQFERKEDIEIVAFLVATIAWGKREMIIRSGERLIEIMGDHPYEFVVNYAPNDLPRFVHRTFNNVDLDFFFRSLQRIYMEGGLEMTFHNEEGGAKNRIISFRNEFLKTDHEVRSQKHLSNPEANSAAKRINMFLRWMVRDDNKGVDFGIWKSISPHELCIPLDVHTGNTSRLLGMLNRKQNDWNALDEIMDVLRKFDANDPAKYDFALFGLGAVDGFR